MAVFVLVYHMEVEILHKPFYCYKCKNGDNPHHAKPVGFFTFSGKRLFTPNPKLGSITCGIATLPLKKDIN